MPHITEYLGPDGLTQMSPEAVRVAKDPLSFTARLKNYRFGSLTLIDITSSAYRAKRSHERLREVPLDIIHVVYVRVGGIRTRQDGRAAFTPAGMVTILRANAAYDYAVSDGCNAYVVSMPLSALALPARRHVPLVTSQPIDEPVVFATAAAFFSPHLANERPLERDGTVVEGLTISLLEQLILNHAEQSGVAVATSDQIMVSNIRRLILEQIERQDLAPATIAADLGTTTRNLYRIFAAEPTNLAAQIRATRLDLLAAYLRVELSRVPFATVARRFGFRSVDACGRAFRERFGCTMTEFRLRRVLPAPLE
ncbi:helix-turn-helix domain-containing protein [Subtercola vilae]|uniref:Helix-turn-helix domain-containing protein n=1 Tax=Subtercola vilae TaxID=2056433 RepID=A0A4T2BZ29_9MICO|nr:helix-turn-helix domain-containing protein [Subtercola vilae]TIH36649.1 helix-turn-helix domain-containing protein [Subtercola vilae]